ncbi:MauE/DoxX family redox-associated membrane protein [Flavobacterium subsaxonicum]|uniref:Protein tlpB n=1 Tax=Flavobacterium subsaxonicum WB 4.1-42 = DSM 21790 TaxID=1121898 RepID=A0A0A2MIP3_9FLAO|nr:MauE/DoxX family redox-associated membrane protein [Flavobacterium subsaxonicum]KGO92512.1 protein tlpB [Flavobacterium subsaxonicum WB 4.1-42 = DSM 21790]
MKDIKKYLPLALRIIVSFLFLLSATAKLYDSPYFAITTFEMKQLIPLGFPEGLAVYFSRTLIGFEFALGFLLLQPHYLKKLVIPTTIALLAVFIIQLSYEIATKGNAGNCGCFGELLPMTPIEAIIKNMVAIGLLLWLLKLLNPWADRTNIWVLTTVIFACILAIFMIAPIARQTTSAVAFTPETTADSLATEELQVEAVTEITTPTEATGIETPAPVTEAPAAEAAPKPVKSIYSQYFAAADKGKKIVGLFAPGCEHCRETVKQLAEMKAKDKNFPELYILFMDEEADLIPDFFKFAGAQYPYKVLDVATFWKTLGNSRDTPGVFYLWNGNKVAEWDGIAEKKFVAADLLKALKKSSSEIKK